MSKKTVGLKARSTLARTGFKRPERVRLPSPPPRPATRRSVMADCSSPMPSIDKATAWEDPALLAMARGKPCLLRSPVCTNDRDTTVACHSNLSIHGKGLSRKADDCFSVWGCAKCHYYLDRDPKPSAEERELLFLVAHVEQVKHWQAIAASTTVSPKDRAAASRALDTLNALAAAHTGASHG